MRITAGVLLRDYEGRVLVIGGELPESESEAGETPLETAERALAEAAGVHRRPGSLLLVDATPGGLTFVFDGGRLDDSGDTGGRFTDVAELSDRIATAVSETGQVYAENGRIPPSAGWGVPIAEDS